MNQVLVLRSPSLDSRTLSILICKWGDGAESYPLSKPFHDNGLEQGLTNFISGSDLSSFVNYGLGEHRHAHPPPSCSWLSMLYKSGVEWWQQRQYNLQSIKYLPSDPLQHMFADPRPRGKWFFLPQAPMPFCPVLASLWYCSSSVHFVRTSRPISEHMLLGSTPGSATH